MENSNKLFVALGLLLVMALAGFFLFDKTFVNQSAKSLDAQLGNQRGGGPITASPPSATEKVIMVGGKEIINMIPWLNVHSDVWSSSDLGANNWSMLTNTPSWANTPGVTSPEIVYFDNKLWLGLFGNGLTDPSISYSLDGVTWNTYNNLPFGSREGATFFVFDDGAGEAMWVIGGAMSYVTGGTPPTTNVLYGDVWKSYDGQNWTQVLANAPWVGRANHTSVVFDNKMWVIGGQGAAAGTYLSDAWSSPDGINWTQNTINGPWGQRTDHSSVVYDGKIWIFGGKIIGTSNYNVWSSSNGANWSLVSTNVPYSGGRHSFSAIVFDNKMWLLAGRSDTTFLEYNDVYSSVDGVNWSPSGPLNAPWARRFNLDAVVVPINFGGCQITVNPIPLPSTTLSFGLQMIAKIEVVGCSEDIYFERVKFLTTQLMASSLPATSFRLVDPYIVNTLSGATAQPVNINYTNGIVSEIDFKPNSTIPQNTTVKFEIWANIAGDPLVPPSLGDTLNSTVSFVNTFVPSTTLPAILSPLPPLTTQTLTY